MATVQDSRADDAPVGYRPDIDGLRAVAVLAVVLYHADLDAFAGGFVGVDVFFVISGYLITSIVWGQLGRGTFSIGGFYERRIRRIFPALFAVVAATVAAAWYWMMPFDLQSFGVSLAVMAAFASNFHFGRTGYFDGGAHVKPLLHTWSLAVEEQFYIVFPIVLALLARRVTTTRWVILLLALASFAVNVFGVRSSVQLAFYMPWQRAWELLVGSLLALGLVPRISGRRAREALAFVGVVAIAVAVFGFDENTPFPGETALLPVLGAALLIHTGGSGPTLVARALGKPAPVFIGLVSYSFYLWHWPIFALARYRLMRELSTVEGLTLAALAYIMAVVSWHFVERPFRHTPGHSAGRGRVRLFVDAVLCIAVAVVIGVYLNVSRGVPERLPEPVRVAAMAAYDESPDSDACHNRSPERVDQDQVCVLGSGSRPSFVLLGDSFADALVPGIDAAARDAGRRGFVITKGGCPPLLEVGPPACQAFNLAALGFLGRHPEIDTVVLMARWSGFAEGSRFGEDRPKLPLTDALSVTPGPEENRRVLERGFERSLKALAPRRIVVIAFMPEQPVSPPRAVAMARQLGSGGDEIGVDRATYDQRQAHARALLDRLVQRGLVSVIDLGAALCAADRCPAERDGIVLYRDDNHISMTAAISIKETLGRAFSL